MPIHTSQGRSKTLGFGDSAPNLDKPAKRTCHSSLPLFTYKTSVTPYQGRTRHSTKKNARSLQCSWHGMPSSRFGLGYYGLSSRLSKSKLAQSKGKKCLSPSSVMNFGPSSVMNFESGT